MSTFRYKTNMVDHKTKLWPTIFMLWIVAKYSNNMRNMCEITCLL